MTYQQKDFSAAFDVNAVDSTKLDHRVNLVGGVGADLTSDAIRTLDVTDKAPIFLSEISGAYTSAQYVYEDVSAYESVLIQAVWSASGPDVTFALSAQNDGTAAASCQYTNVSQYGITILDGTTAAAQYVDTITVRIDVRDAEYLRVGLGQNVAFGGTPETITVIANAKPIV